MRAKREKNLFKIFVDYDEYLQASDAEIEYVLRHELMHDVLDGPITQIKSKLVPKACKGIVRYSSNRRYLDQFLQIWQEFIVDLDMIEKFPELSKKYYLNYPKLDEVSLITEKSEREPVKKARFNGYILAYYVAKTKFIIVKKLSTHGKDNKDLLEPFLVNLKEITEKIKSDNLLPSNTKLEEVFSYDICKDKIHLVATVCSLIA